MKKAIVITNMFFKEIRECHIGAYASSAAFFMFLSLIPILLLVCSVLPYTPITEADLMVFVAKVVPINVVPLAVNTIVEVYDKSPAIISISAVVTIWTSGKGMLAIIRGLNAVNGCNTMQNYFMQRLRACIYTVFLLIMIFVSLMVGVFGKSIGKLLQNIFVESDELRLLVSNLRMLFVLALLMLFFTALFTWIPNVKTDWKIQMIGACFVSVAWVLFSYGFSLYVEHFTTDNIYGSMTTIVILMLWFYFAFYLMFLGALISRFLSPATEFMLKKRAGNTGKTT